MGTFSNLIKALIFTLTDLLFELAGLARTENLVRQADLKLFNQQLSMTKTLSDGLEKINSRPTPEQNPHTLKPLDMSKFKVS